MLLTGSISLLGNMPNYEHLKISREPIVNSRRTGKKRNLPKYPRGDLATHRTALTDNLDGFRQTTDPAKDYGFGKYIIKLCYSGFFKFEGLKNYGIEFISQENNEVCIGFATEEGLTLFSDHISKLGISDEELTYKDILTAIDSIESWTAEDRKSWAVIHKGYPNKDHFCLDIELWPFYVQGHPERLSACLQFENWLSINDIQKVDHINLDSLLMYRIKINCEQIGLVENHPAIRLIDLPPDSGISYQQLNRDVMDLPNQISSPEIISPKICILDSGLTTNHPLLAPAVADNTSFIGEESELDENGHGTAVAGIVLYGDVEACNDSNSWNPPFYKVLDANGEFDLKTIESSIVEAVNYFYGNHGCRIFNLSIGNANAPYDSKHIGGIAYVLDKLSRDLDILFVVSAGNFNGSSNPDVPEQSWRNEYPEYLLTDQNRIIDPAPALNAITVGSVAKHNATFNSSRYPEINELSPAAENQPSPFTRHGPSVKGAIKPDLSATGGNLACPVRIDQQYNSSEKGLGVLTLSNHFIGKTLLTEVSGTSFAAPYVTHLAGRLLKDYPDASMNLIRAMLVNQADVPSETESLFSDERRKQYKEEYRREIFRDVVGYGVIDESELFRSSENVVVMRAEESISNDEHQFYELPLPENFLRSQRVSREIRITLAYCPAVKTTRIEYMATKLTFTLVKGDSLQTVERSFNQKTKSDTDRLKEHAASNRDISADLRGKSSVQSSVWRLKQLKPNDKWFVVITRQDKEWGKVLSSELENYALVVTVADRENEEAKLYAQISQRIAQKIQERTKLYQPSLF